MTEKEFSKLLKGNQKRFDKPSNVLNEALGVSVRTMKTYINEPKQMRVGDLILISEELHIRDDELISYLKG